MTERRARINQRDKINGAQWVTKKGEREEKEGENERSRSAK